MSTQISLAEKLIRSIDNASNFSDLFPILNAAEFDIELIKNLVKKEISTMTIKQQCVTYLKSASLDEILPDDILKHIISFSNDFRNIELTNKLFRNCSNAIHSLFMHRSRTDYQNEFDHSNSMNINSKNRIFKIYPSICNDYTPLKASIAAAQSGDTLLIHEGVYSFPKHEVLEISNNIKLIGFGPNVVIKGFDDEYQEMTNSVQCTAEGIYIQNIKFEEVCIELNERTSLWMEYCRLFIEMQGIFSFSNNTVKVKDCVIFGGERSTNNYGGVYFGGDPQKIEIESCLFEELSKDSVHYDHCITFWLRDIAKPREIKLIRNHFKNNYKYPISGIDLSMQLEIYDNTLEGFNGINSVEQVTTANKLYPPL